MPSTELTTSHASNRSMSSIPTWAIRVKHGVDRVVALLVLLALAPLLLAIAVAVRLSSPGPVFFRQRRVGLGGREFELYKFRTMVNGSASGPRALAAGVAPGGVEGTDRRTWIGRWLRAASLDELPQFINVLRGDMSVIGPRPERPDYAKRFALEIPGYIDRLRVKCGITGWAQANGLRGQTSIAERVAHDNYYIDHWSLGLELRTVALTVVEVLRFRDRAPKQRNHTAPRPACRSPRRCKSGVRLIQLARRSIEPQTRHRSSHSVQPATPPSQPRSWRAAPARTLIKSSRRPTVSLRERRDRSRTHRSGQTNS